MSEQKKSIYELLEADIMNSDLSEAEKAAKLSRLIQVRSKHVNIMLVGATGSGKTYMACAFGMEACKQYYTVKYVRLPDLLLELEMARNDGTYKKGL